MLMKKGGGDALASRWLTRCSSSSFLATMAANHLASGNEIELAGKGCCQSSRRIKIWTLEAKDRIRIDRNKASADGCEMCFPRVLETHKRDMSWSRLACLGKHSSRYTTASA